MFKKLLFVLFAVSIIAGCSEKKSEEKFLDPKDMDLTVDPGNDFYQYANGNWLKNNPVPDEYSRYGAFDKLVDDNFNALREIMETSAKDSTVKKGSNAQKVGDFYSSGMDTIKIEKEGITPLKAEFDKIESIKDLKDFQKILAHQHLIGLAPIFGTYSGPDAKNSNMVIAGISQAGLGLSDRDYYLNNDPRSVDIRKEYVMHINNIFKLMGYKEEDAKKASEKILAIETQLAKSSMNRLDQRDPNKTYNKMDIAALTKLAPAIDWKMYFSDLGIDIKDLTVAEICFFKDLSSTLKKYPIDDWKTYLKWNLINGTAVYLSSDFVKEHFNFYNVVLSGSKKMQPRWKRVLKATNYALGEAVGQVYVEKYFPPEAKTRMLELVHNLKIAFNERISKLDWMGEKTKKEALDKLNAMRVKIGYPNKWLDYSNLTIDRESYVLNAIKADEFSIRVELNKIGKPVDIESWEMTPQTVNAYYNPLSNEIVFPAAILQPPFFFLKADDAVNYGAIGSVIGHEMTHGFDDQGRLFDKNGNLNEWWTKDDAEKFQKKAEVIVKQFNNFKALDTLHLNGQLTLGENIADLGGITISYVAFLKSQEGKKEQQKIDGFTPNQRFFLSIAKVFRENIRDKALMNNIKEDVHSPAKFRINGALFNIPAFYESFDIKKGTTLYRSEEERAKIW